MKTGSLILALASAFSLFGCKHQAADRTAQVPRDSAPTENTVSSLITESGVPVLFLSGRPSENASIEINVCAESKCKSYAMSDYFLVDQFVGKNVDVSWRECRGSNSCSSWVNLFVERQLPHSIEGKDYLGDHFARMFKIFSEIPINAKSKPVLTELYRTGAYTACAMVKQKSGTNTYHYLKVHLPLARFVYRESVRGLQRLGFEGEIPLHPLLMNRATAEDVRAEPVQKLNLATIEGYYFGQSHDIGGPLDVRIVRSQANALIAKAHVYNARGRIDLLSEGFAGVLGEVIEIPEDKEILDVFANLKFADLGSFDLTKATQAQLTLLQKKGADRIFYALSRRDHVPNIYLVASEHVLLRAEFMAGGVFEQMSDLAKGKLKILSNALEAMAKDDPNSIANFHIYYRMLTDSLNQLETSMEPSGSSSIGRIVFGRETKMLPYDQGIANRVQYVLSSFDDVANFARQSISGKPESAQLEGMIKELEDEVRMLAADYEFSVLTLRENALHLALIRRVANDPKAVPFVQYGAKHVNRAIADNPDIHMTVLNPDVAQFGKSADQPPRRLSPQFNKAIANLEDLLRLPASTLREGRASVVKPAKADVPETHVPSLWTKIKNVRFW